MAGKDATGGLVRSLTEASMGQTHALVMVAASLDSVADAILELGKAVVYPKKPRRC